MEPLQNQQRQSFHGTKITSQVSTAKSKVQTIIDLVNQTAAALNVESAFTDDSGDLL